MCADAVCRFRSGKDKVIYTTDKPTYNYIYFNFHILKVISSNRHLSLHLPISDLSKWPCPLSTQKRITTNFNRDLISTFWSSFFAVDQSEPDTCGFVCLRVMPKMQTSRDLQYIAPGDKGGWRDEARRCRGETDTNPLLANRLSYSPEPDRERRRAGGRLTQNLSCWDYLIDVNHWFIVEILPDVFPEDAGPSNMDSQRLRAS